VQQIEKWFTPASDKTPYTRNKEKHAHEAALREARKKETAERQKLLANRAQAYEEGGDEEDEEASNKNQSKRAGRRGGKKRPKNAVEEFMEALS
jgi:hypothetical protein